MKKDEAWAIRYWRWKTGVDRYADLDLAVTQEEVFRRFPTKAMARSQGRKMAKDPNNVSPGMFDLMRGTPDRYSMDGWEWQVAEEIKS